MYRANTEVCNKGDIRRFFQRLNHGEYGCTEVRVITPGVGIHGVGYFDNEDDFVEECSQWSGKANVYAGRNPRPVHFLEYAPNGIKEHAKCSKKKDIAVVTAVAIDIDPVRPKGQPSTKSELVSAINAAMRIAGPYRNATVDNTGNGAAIWLPVEPIRVEEGLEAKLKLFEQSFKNALTDRERAEVNVDSIYDLGRVNKVIGTMSVKGRTSKERPHRLTSFVTHVAYEPVPGLKELILSLEPGLPTKTAVKEPKSATRQVSSPSGPMKGQLRAKLEKTVEGMPVLVRHLWENGYPDDRSLGGSVALQYFLWKRYEPDDAVTVAMDADMRWGKFHAQGRPSKGREYMMNLAQTIISKGKGRIKPPYRTLKAMYGVKSVYELPKDVGRCN